MSDPAQRPEMIRERLIGAFAPTVLEIADDSHLHAGHASAGGAGHFRVNIVAAVFEGKNTVQRHRMVYGALADMMADDIHALSIRARTPLES